MYIYYIPAQKISQSIKGVVGESARQCWVSFCLGNHTMTKELTKCFIALTPDCLLNWRHDVQPNDIQHIDTQHSDTQHDWLICDAQHNSIESRYAECRNFLLLC